MTEQEQPTLWERVGGLEAVQFMARTVVTRAILNPTIGHIWNHKTENEVQAEIRGFVDFLSEHWGGPLKYDGRDMVSIHRGMGVTEEYWSALLDDVIAPAYEEFKLDPQLAKDIDDFLRSFKPVIVGSPALRQVLLENPDMDVMQGMKSAGVIWPAPVGTDEVTTTVRRFFHARSDAKNWEPFLVGDMAIGEFHSIRENGSDPDRVLQVALWRSEPQTFPYTFENDETLYLIEGSVEVEYPDGEKVRIAPGDVVSFTKGQTTTWRILTASKKLFVVAG